MDLLNRTAATLNSAKSAHASLTAHVQATADSLAEIRKSVSLPDALARLQSEVNALHDELRRASAEAEAILSAGADLFAAFEASLTPAPEPVKADSPDILPMTVAANQPVESTPPAPLSPSQDEPEASGEPTAKRHAKTRARKS